MKKVLIPVLGLLALFVGCKQAPESTATVEQVESHVLTAEAVESKTPDQIIDVLKAGNKSFVTNHLHKRDYNAQLRESLAGQHPWAIVLSCIDSRVPVEVIFDQGLGDLFVARIAGNVVSGDVLGSMEYACEHAKSKVVVVMGHECCGAVHAACEHVEAGNMTDMLAKIKPAIEEADVEGGDHHSEEFQNKVIRHNVENMVERVREESEILRELEAKGEIKIVGAVFNLHTGLVEFV